MTQALCLCPGSIAEEKFDKQHGRDILKGPIYETFFSRQLRCWCEAKDFGHERNKMRLKFVKTESFGSRKTS
jgi:hypothetical protein